ncbi:MAG: XRE family transcriptional regulator [Desulfobacterales bacterium]|nr:XRE family transcriptional regulator [Desulfobacterales bacterium]
MSYILKHFDNSLIRFNITSSGIKGLSLEIIETYEKYKSFFPIDLELTNSGLLQWLRRRIIPKNRAFVQSFLAKLGLNVNDTKGIIDICKGLSLNDCYWVVDDNFKDFYSEYNLYDNGFDHTLSLIAYTGYGDTQKSEFASTPELTTDGMLPKCWRRMKNGKIILYKTGSSGAANAGNEPYSEYYAFQVAETMGLKAVKYNLNQWKKRLCSTCELFTSKKLSYIPTGRIVTKGGWPAVTDYYKSLAKEFYDSLVDMLIFDAVICNEDRHFGNFGLIVDNKTNSVVDTAPVFDNGLSLFNYAMKDDLYDADTYAKTRLMANSQDFLTFAKEIITKDQKKKLQKLINFKFKKHKSYNLPASRLKIIETFIQERVQELLLIPTVPD